ncbi:MAG: hypothetical protein ACO2ZK_11540, partial [Gemmobacter sp.]
MSAPPLPAAGETLARALWMDEDGHLRARAAAGDWVAGMPAGALQATLEQLARAGVPIGAPAAAAAALWPADGAMQALGARHAADPDASRAALARLRAIVAGDPAQAPVLARVLRGGMAGAGGPGAALEVLGPALAAGAGQRQARILALECCLDQGDPAAARAHLGALAAEGDGALFHRALELAFDIALAEGGVEALLAEARARARDAEQAPGALRRLIRHL